jgi:hypothetical protein
LPAILPVVAAHAEAANSKTSIITASLNAGFTNKANPPCKIVRFFSESKSKIDRVVSLEFLPS